MNKEYMVFILINGDYIQRSVIINTYEEAEEFCKIFFTEAAHYLIVEIIKKV